MAELELECVEQAGDWTGVAAEAWLPRIAAAIAAREGAGGLVTVVLADDATVQDLNARFRGKDRPTNVLSFPAGAQPQGMEDDHLGDIILAVETLRREAGEQEKTLVNHFVHLVVHGVLHILGYDHLSDDEAERMESLERAVMADLGLPDPYAGADEPVGEAN